MIKTKTTSDQLTEDSLIISWLFNAPPDLVFKAWTEPEHVKQWWGPKGFTCPVCRINLRVGGTYLNCMRSPAGKEFWSAGTYQQIIEPKLIVCTDSFADPSGKIVSPEQYGMNPDWPQEANIAVTFDDQDGKTLLTLNHWPLKPGPDRNMCQQGWSESFDKLADYLDQLEDQSIKLQGEKYEY